MKKNTNQKYNKKTKTNKYRNKYRNKQKKTKINNSIKKLRGGGNLHYIISCHGSSQDITEMSTIIPNLKIFTYAKDYGYILDINCAYNLQTYLTHYRDENNNLPTCIENRKPRIDNSILNLRLYVENTDTWNSGIVDITTVNNPIIIQTWNSYDSNYNKGYTLNNALLDIYRDANKYYGLNTIKVHLLTCL